MEIVIQMKELRGIITLQSRLVEVRSERALYEAFNYWDCNNLVDFIDHVVFYYRIAKLGFN